MSGAKKKRHPLRDGLEYASTVFIFGILRLLPERWARAVGRGLGAAAYALIPGRRRIALDNLRRAFPSPDFDVEGTALEVYRIFGENLVEFFLAAERDREALLRTIEFEGQAHMEDALRGGRGVLLLASHYGNWELMGLAHSAKGYPIHMAARRLDNPRLDRWLNRRRERFGSTVIDSKSPSALRRMLTVLRAGGSAAFLIDQNVVGDRGVFVDFFGRLAYTHKVVSLLAMKTGAPVIPVFMRREKEGGHRMIYHKPLTLVRTGNRDEDVLENTRMMARVLEEEVRVRPEQWLWFHDRWKKQPPRAAAAVFLDRDGTITTEIGYIHDPDRLELLPGSAEAIRRLNQGGIPVIVVTNQSGVARGYYPEETVQRVNARLLQLLQTQGAEVAGVYYCPHHPTEGTGPLTRSCDCRKPEPGLLHRARSEHGLDLSRSFVVGDKESDIALARRVGARGIMVLTGYGGGELKKAEKTGLAPDFVAADLAKAVDWILSQVPVPGA